MSRESFETNCYAALTRIIERLHAVATEFGPTDFPEDAGKALRNRYCNFAHTFFDVIAFYCFEEPEDAWAIANGRLVKDAQPGVLYSLAGATHFYIECFTFARFLVSRSDLAKVLWPNDSIRTLLDWLTNIYAVPPEVPVAWDKITTSADSFESFTNHADRYLEETAAFELGRSLDASEHSWSGLALAVDLAAAAFIDEAADAAEWDAQCDEIFST